MNEHHYSAHYKLNGKWYFTEKALSKDELPEAVKKAIKISRYADWEDKSVAYVENEKGSKLYRVEMKKGIEEIFVFYDAQGKEKKSNLKL